MQGSWVGGQSPLGQGSPRKRRDAASGNGRRGEVCLYVTGVTGVRTR